MPCAFQSRTEEIRDAALWAWLNPTIAGGPFACPQNEGGEHRSPRFSTPQSHSSFSASSSRLLSWPEPSLLPASSLEPLSSRPCASASLLPRASSRQPSSQQVSLGLSSPVRLSLQEQLFWQQPPSSQGP